MLQKNLYLLFLLITVLHIHSSAEEIPLQDTWDQISTEKWLGMAPEKLMAHPFVEKQGCEIDGYGGGKYLECPAYTTLYEGLPTRLRFYFMPDKYGVPDYIASVQISLDPNLGNNEPANMCSWLLHSQRSKWGDYQNEFSVTPEEFRFTWEHDWGNLLVYCNPPEHAPQISLEYSLPIWPFR